MGLVTASPTWEHIVKSTTTVNDVMDADAVVILHELKATLASIIVDGRGCHETMRQLEPLLSNLPSPVPHLLSPPKDETIPLPRFGSVASQDVPVSPITMRAQL